MLQPYEGSSDTAEASGDTSFTADDLIVRFGWRMPRAGR